MTRLFLILLLSIGTILHASGQENFLSRPDKILPTDKQWTELQSKFNSIPIDRLKFIEKELDSIISATDCYKFIHNADTTKFLAIFVQRKDNPSYSRLTHFGQVVHRHYQPSGNNPINFYAYILWGMKYENQWYYNKHLENEFWDKDIKAAQLNFLFFILRDVGFLKTKDEKFWLSGGDYKHFKILPKNNFYLEEYAGLPEIVGWHMVSQGGRQKQLLNEKIERTACAIEDELWNSLHRSDSVAFHTRYKSRYSGNSCLVLYNSDRSKILLPILYYDSKSNPWLTYYFLKITSTDTVLYHWTKFPTKKIIRKSGDESLEIIYDIRNFIQNWGWGTVNMISTDSFWTDNFTDKDLEPIKNNVR